MTGKAGTLEDILHPDWLPLQHLGNMHHAHSPGIESVERYERLKRRRELKAQRDESDTDSDGNNFES